MGAGVGNACHDTWGTADYVLSRRDVVDVIAQCDEEVEEELSAAIVHLQLHGAAALEGAAGADDER